MTLPPEEYVHDLQKEAKLGAEENTFFFDEERKIWRERGAAIPVEAAPLPPPPTARLPGSSAPSTGVVAHLELLCVHSTSMLKQEADAEDSRIMLPCAAVCILSIEVATSEG